MFEVRYCNFSNLVDNMNVLPSRELTYPTLGKGKIIFKMPFWGGYVGSLEGNMLESTVYLWICTNLHLQIQLNRVDSRFVMVHPISWKTQMCQIYHRHYLIWTYFKQHSKVCRPRPGFKNVSCYMLLHPASHGLGIASWLFVMVFFTWRARKHRLHLFKMNT